MNKNCYKTIYSRNLGRIVVVSERARNVGKTRSQGSRGAWQRLLPLSWRVALVLGSLGILPAGAEIIADSDAVREHQPQVLLSSEGVPQVDIQAPTAAGVSVNEYTRFDVGGEGAILNNSRKGAPTHIGGWVSGNPNLLKSDASVIVNQVNSSDPSRLHGTLEVAGKRADVIIANPAGISVNGGRFINADKAWLTSGKPELQDGAFRGVNVGQGRITVGAGGLDVRDSNYAAIIAKAAQIDGPVRAGDKKLDIITGTNRVDSDGNVQKSGGGSAAPVAIDTGHLGGMYGGSIRLISSDRGVGVNHAGVVQAQQLHISADGKLENRGSIQGDNLQVDAQALANHGKISQGNGTLNITAGNVDNHGGIYRNRVAAQDAVQDGKTSGKAKAATGKSADGHIRLKGTLANNGQITSGGEVNLSAARDLNNSGDIDAGTLRVAEGSHKNSGNIRTRNAALSGRRLDNRGSISAADTLTVHTKTLENDGSLRASALDLAGDSLYNRGEISGTGSGEMQITTASWHNLGYVGRGGEKSGAATGAKTGAATDNSGGGTGGSRLRYTRINNEGSISQAGGVSLDVKGEFANHGSMTLNSLTYRGETLDNRDGRLQTQKADISAHTLDNENGLFAAGHISRLDLTGKLNNKNGTFYSGDDLRFTVPHFENPAGSSFGSGKTLSVKSDTLNNDGRLFAANVLELQTQQLNNRGSLQGGALAIDAGTLTNSGQIEQTGRGTLTMRAQNLDNQQTGIIGKSPADGKNGSSAGSSSGATSATAADGHISVSGTLTNSGRISAAGKLRLEGGAKIHNAGHIQIEELASRGTLLDNHGHLQADNAWLSGDVLTNYGALIAGTYHEFRYDQSVTNHGHIYGRHDYRIDSPQITNHQGAHIGGAAGLQLGGNVDNRGDIRAQRLGIDAGGTLTNSGNLIGTEQLQLSGIHTTNSSSGLIYGGRTDIDGGSLTNHGRIGAARELRFTLPQLTNHGQLFSAGLITGEVARLDNHELIRGQTVTLRGMTLNNHGQIAADSRLTLEQQQLTNHGLLDAARFAISGRQLDNHGIIRQRGGTLAIKTGQLDNRGNIGLLPADKPATGSGNGTSPAPGNSVANSGTSGGSGSIELAGINNHSGGAILSAGQTDLSVNQQQLVNHGKMQLGTFHYSGDALDNYGKIRARRGELSGKTLTNREGAVLSAGDFATFNFTDNIKNSGTLYSDSNFRLHSTHIENHGANSLIASSGTLDINSERVENRGRIQSGGSLQGNIGSLENSGLLGSGGNLQLDLQRLDNQGTGQLLARGRLSLAVSGAIRQYGQITAGGPLQLHVPLLANHGTIQGAATTLHIDGKLDNRGTIAARGSQHITADSITNRGTLGAGSSQHINSRRLDNAGLVTAASLHLKSDTLDNRGDIRQTGSAGFNIRVAELDNRQGATLGENRAADHPAPGGRPPATPATPPATGSGTNGSITATTLTNSGNIVAGGAVDLTTTKRLNNDGTLRASRLLADGEKMRSTGDIDATDAVIRSKDTDIGGRFSGQHLDLDIEHYTNRAILRFDHINWNKLKTLSNYGDIDSKTSLNFRMTRLENGAGGSLRTAGTFDFNGEHLKNDGTLLSQGAQTITARHIENGGLLASGAGQTLRAGKISHHAGGEIDATHIDWQADTINNDGAVFIGGNSTLTISAPAITNHGIIGQTDINLPNRAHQLSEAVARAQQAAQPQNPRTAQNPPAPAPQNPPPALPASKVEARKQLSIGSSQGGFISNGRVSVTTPNLANHGKMRLAELDVAGTASDPGTFTNSGQIDADTTRIITPDIHNSGTLASANLTLETERLQNSGTLAGEHSYTVNAKESIKNSGNILSGKTLTLNSPYLESSGGRISAVDLILNLPDYLHNGGKIIARHLTLNTPHLKNSGHIYGEADYQVKVDTLVNSGILSSPGKLTVAALHDRLAIANDGQILAGQTELTADSLHGSGTVSGADSATVRVGSVSGSQSITAGRHLQLDVAGELSTSGTIGAGGVADIRAANIHNGGKLLAGQELNLTAGTLNNTGLINTSGTTRIRVNHLANHGRLYGDWVDLITPYLKNHDGAVIAARRHLEVDGGTIDNRLGSANGAAPLIKSDGSMLLKGQSLDNGGGTVQSAGNMELRGLRVKNDNPYFQTYTKVEEKKGQQFMRSLDDNAPNRGLHERSKFKEGQRKYIARDPGAVGGIKEVNRTQEITADVRTETTEVAHSTPGRILAGGNLIVNATSITNDKGQVIAGGTITYQNGGNIHNQDAERTTQTFYNGTYENTVDTKRKWGIGHKRRTYAKGEYHDSTPPQTGKMNIVKTAAHSDPGLIAHDNSAGSDVAVSSGPVERIESGGYVTTGVNQLLPDGQLFQSADNGRDPLLRTDPDYIGGVTVDIPAYRKPAAPQGGTQPPAVAQADRSTAQARARNGKEALALVEANLADRLKARLNRIEGRLADINPQDAPQNGVRFGVDQNKIAALEPWLPPGLDPHDLHKPIGDLYANLELVRRQLALQTGRLQLPGEGDEIGRYKALLASGEKIRARFGLKPGVALSAAQMAELTGDALLMVNTRVRGADGRWHDVNVPQLYSKKRQGDVDGRRTLISGEHIAGRAGNLDNHAIFNARQSNTLQVAKADNRGGTLSARDLLLESDSAIDNTGGEIRARRILNLK
ncbi:two-partner secretion domain-containing protein, partial [Cardiobacterium valvarum]